MQDAPAQPLTVGVTVEQLWQPVPGGSGTYVSELVSELAARDDVSVVGIAAHHGHPPDGVTIPVDVRHSPLPRRIMYDSWHIARRPRSSVPRAAEVVHATTWAIPPRTAPLVATVHDLAFLRNPEHFTSRGNRFFRRGLEIVKAEADLVVTPSWITAADCVEAGITADRIRVVPLAARAVPVTREQVSNFRLEHGLTRPFVLWCGTLEPRKNLPTLMRAFSQLAADHHEIDLVLVGPAGWGDLNLGTLDSGRVHRLGRLTAAELPVAYSAARAFAFPSTWEGFGLPVLEAMSYGVPVVTSVGTSMAEFAGTAAILVEPTDAGALADGLLRALGDEHDARAAAGLEVAGRHTWRNVAHATAQAYLEARQISGS